LLFQLCGLGLDLCKRVIVVALFALIGIIVVIRFLGVVCIVRVVGVIGFVIGFFVVGIAVCIVIRVVVGIIRVGTFFGFVFREESFKLLVGHFVFLVLLCAHVDVVWHVLFLV
jgi:hypothetical protein